MSGYREFIDGMVGLARICVRADRLRQYGHAERTNDRDLALSAEEASRKQVMLSLTKDQREAVAQLLESERSAAIHDVIANLDAYDLALEGKALFDQADEEPKGDFVSRSAGEPWHD